MKPFTWNRLLLTWGNTSVRSPRPTCPCSVRFQGTLTLVYIKYWERTDENSAVSVRTGLSLKCGMFGLAVTNVGIPRPPLKVWLSRFSRLFDCTIKICIWPGAVGVKVGLAVLGWQVDVVMPCSGWHTLKRLCQVPAWFCCGITLQGSVLFLYTVVTVSQFTGENC